MKHASLCTGIGACELAATWMKWENLFSCEIDEFCNKVLKYHYPNSKHYGNIFGTDFRKWRGQVDVLTAGFPCQPFSVAGARNGAEDYRYLWPEVLRVVNEIRPAWFIGENVAGITSMVLPGEEVKVGSYTDICGESYTMYETHQRYVIEQIRLDLESIGYKVQPIVIPACAVGANHRRYRIWFTANRSDARIEDLQRERTNGIHAIGDATDPSCERCDDRSDNREERQVCSDGERNSSEDKQERNEMEHRTSKVSSITPDSDSDICRNRKSEQEFVHECKRTSNDSESREDGITPDPDSKRLSYICFTGCPKEEEREIENRCSMQYTSDDREAYISDWWQDFPTQSPVCSRDDGVSGRLSGITFSRWRQESIKALGNSMVPQVVYEIFRAIELVDKTFTN